MTITAHGVLMVLTLICLAIAIFGLPPSKDPRPSLAYRINWIAAGLFLWALADSGFIH